jgi:hypothetical protein
MAGPHITASGVAAAPSTMKRASYVAGFHLPPSQQPPLPPPQRVVPAQTLPAPVAPPTRVRPSKATKHRKRHIPVGPAGIWFQTQQQQKEGSGRSIDASSLNNSEKQRADDENENPNPHCGSNSTNTHQDDDSSNAVAVHSTDANYLQLASPETRRRQRLPSTALSFLAPAWRAAHTALGIVTAPCPAYVSLAHKYALLRPHLPHEYLLVSDIHNGAADWKMRHPQRLLVQVETVHSVTSDLLWTVTLQDETGASMVAWLQPALVQAEQRHAKHVRPGTIWLLTGCTIQQGVESVHHESHSNGQDEGDSMHRTEELTHDDGQCSGISRLLLVSESNIAQSWSISDGEQLSNAEYVRWFETRNSLVHSNADGANRPLPRSNINDESNKHALNDDDVHSTDPEYLLGNEFNGTAVHRPRQLEGSGATETETTVHVPVCALQTMACLPLSSPDRDDCETLGPESMGTDGIVHAKRATTGSENVTPVLRQNPPTETAQSQRVGASLAQALDECDRLPLQRDSNVSNLVQERPDYSKPQMDARELSSSRCDDPLIYSEGNKNINSSQFASRSERPPLALLPVASSLSVEDRQLHANGVSKAHQKVEHRNAQALETRAKTPVKRKRSSAQAAPALTEQNSLFSAANAATMELFDDDDQDLENSSEAVLPQAPVSVVNHMASASLSANVASTLFEGISLKGFDMDALFDDDDD